MSFGFNKFGDFGDKSIYYQTQSSKKLENYFVQMKKIIDEKPQDYFVDSIKENAEDSYLELYDTTVYDHLFKESLVHYKLPETDVLRDDTLLVIVKDAFMGMHTAMCRKSLSKYYPYKYRTVSFYQNPLLVPQKCANELKSGSRYVLIIKSDLITSSKSDGIGEKKKTKRELKTVYVYALKDLQTNEVYYAGKPMSGFGFTPVRQYMALNQILRKMSRKYDW